MSNALPGSNGADDGDEDEEDAVGDVGDDAAVAEGGDSAAQQQDLQYTGQYDPSQQFETPTTLKQHFMVVTSLADFFCFPHTT